MQKFQVFNTPSDVCVDPSLSHNSSNIVSGTTETEPVILFTKYMEVLEILEELEVNANANFTGCKNKYKADEKILE